LAAAQAGGQPVFDAFLHRLRGDILLKRDPANPAPAEQAYQTAIAIAKEQGARSWGLRAALALAKLYQSISRPAEAHAVLAPALDGFAPTPEMPEIAEAEALLAVLAESDEVKAGEARRERRLRLQTSYGQAMMWSKGFAADETKSALARATELAAGSDDSSAHLAVHYGQCAACVIRGEMREAEAVATRYLQEAEAAKDRLHAACARTWLGVTRWCQGKLSAAQATFERTLAEWSPEPDCVESLGDRIDPGVHAASYLANCGFCWNSRVRTRTHP
jgi:hypothetical protein